MDFYSPKPVMGALSKTVGVLQQLYDPLFVYIDVENRRLYVEL